MTDSKLAFVINFSEILMELQTFSCQKFIWKCCLQADPNVGIIIAVSKLSLQWNQYLWLANQERDIYFAYSILSNKAFQYQVAKIKKSLYGFTCITLMKMHTWKYLYNITQLSFHPQKLIHST